MEVDQGSQISELTEKQQITALLQQVLIIKY